jgi:hypothetical protein
MYQRSEDALRHAAFAPAHIEAVLVLQSCKDMTIVSPAA